MYNVPMKKIIAFAVFPLVAVGADVAPAHFWNFDKLEWNSRQAVDLGTAQAKWELRGRIATGQGAGGSEALRADVEGTGEIVRCPLPWTAFTFDCSLRSSPKAPRPARWRPWTPHSKSC